MEQPTVFALFPIPIYVVKCDVDISSALSFLNKDFTCLKNEYSNEYGNRSVDGYILDHPECSKLKEFVLFHIEKFADNILAWDFEKFQLTQSWLTIKNHSERHGAHYHPNSVLSAAFYFQESSELIEPIVFHRPDFMSQLMNMFAPSTSSNKMQHTEFPWNEYIVQPQQNTLVIFPSWLSHSVRTNNSTVPRKCIAMNAIPSGRFGSSESAMELDLSRLK